jgi:hypothetical protein
VCKPEPGFDKLAPESSTIDILNFQLREEVRISLLLQKSIGIDIIREIVLICHTLQNCGQFLILHTATLDFVSICNPLSFSISYSLLFSTIDAQVGLRVSFSW